MARDERGSIDFREAFGHDVNDSHIWLDLKAFGREIEIDGHKILGVMTRERAQDYQRTGETEGYSRGIVVLYVRSRDIKQVMPGQLVKINGAKYVVKTQRDLLGEMMCIELEGIDP